MNGQDREVRFEIVEHIGVLKEHSTGWRRELNRIACGIQNEEVDAKIEEALAASSQEDAIKAWKEVQALVDAEYTNLYIVNIEHAYFVSDAIDLSMDTQIPHPHGHGGPIICNMVDWTIK